jgi:hypothetical protein
MSSFDEIKKKLFNSRHQTKKCFIKLYWLNPSHGTMHLVVIFKNKNITQELMRDKILCEFDRLINSYNNYYKTNLYKVKKCEILEENKNVYYTYPIFLQTDLKTE